MADPVEALSAAGRVTVLAICLLAAAHVVGTAWTKGALAATSSDDDIRPDLVGLARGGGA
jgi:hypothetical protein